MSRPVLTPGAVSAAMAAAAALIGPELRGGAGSAGSVRLRAHAVEAVLFVHPAVGADAALALVGLTGADAALRVAAVMSGEGWQPRLVDELARLLRLLDAHPAARAAAPLRASGQLRPSPIARSATVREAHNG